MHVIQEYYSQRNKETKRKFNTPSIYSPDYIVGDKNLSPIEKDVYSIFRSLHEQGKCIYMTNSYLAKMINRTERRVQQILQSLERKAYILRKMTDSVSRTIKVLSGKDKAQGRISPPPKSEFHPCLKKISPNNIINNINITTTEETSTGPVQMKNLISSSFSSGLRKDNNADTTTIRSQPINKTIASSNDGAVQNHKRSPGAVIFTKRPTEGTGSNKGDYHKSHQSDGLQKTNDQYGNSLKGTVSEINIDALRKYAFTNNHMIQLLEIPIPAEELQASVDRYAQHLSKQGVAQNINCKVRYFMKTMRRWGTYYNPKSQQSIQAKPAVIQAIPEAPVTAESFKSNEEALGHLMPKLPLESEDYTRLRNFFKTCIEKMRLIPIQAYEFISNVFKSIREKGRICVTLEEVTEIVNKQCEAWTQRKKSHQSLFQSASLLPAGAT